MSVSQFSFIGKKKNKGLRGRECIPHVWILGSRQDHSRILGFTLFFPTIESDIHCFLLFGLHFPCESFEPIRACLVSHLTVIMILRFSNAK
jgi:hypothetical protein